jgi:hypothetical protein
VFRSTGASANVGVFFLDVFSGSTVQLTADDPPGPPNLFLAIDDAGTRIAFASTVDLTGENGDRNLEIFLVDAATGVTQITHTTAGRNITPASRIQGTS